MKKKEIEVVRGFQSSVNISYDLNNYQKINNFIPITSSLEVIGEILLSTVPTSLQRSRMLIGAYGRGKSHIILVLASILFKKEPSLFEGLLSEMKKKNPQLHDFTKNYIDSNQRLLPIIVRGNSSSLTQSFLNALQQSLNEEGLGDLMPDTHFEAALNTIDRWKKEYPETYKKFESALNESIEGHILALKEYDGSAYEKFNRLYPDLTSGSTFNPFLGFDVVELYEKVSRNIRDKGYNGIYIIYDEFSKYLESNITNATISDIKLLQDLAEKCDRSGANQMHLLLISHKDIATYIDNNLPKEKVDGWRGISGRFKHMHLSNNFSQMYELMSAVIKKDPQFWKKFTKEHKDVFDDLKKSFTDNGLFYSKDEYELESAIVDCYPLHPVSTFILPRLSERVAQNERTTFTFLSADEKFTLNAFLDSDMNKFSLLTPDLIYDYFEPLLKKESYMSEIHKLYKLTSTVLRKVDPNSLGAKIIKTISLIYAIEQFEKLPPTHDMIVDTFRNSVENIEDITSTLSELINKECIIYLKRSNNYLKLKESSGVNIPQEISKLIERDRASLRVEAILNQSSFDNYMYPTRYNDEYEMTRYFDFSFIQSSDFWDVDNWDLKLSKTSADGIIYAIIPSNQSEIKKLTKELEKNEKHHHGQIVFVVPQKHSDIEKIALDYEAVKRLKSLAADDDLLNDEYEIYSEDLTEMITGFIHKYTRPENDGATYVYLGEKKRLYRKAHMSNLLSDICEKIFSRTPTINNESINKNNVSGVATTSRTKLLTGLLKNEIEPNLGLTGTGQDVSIMRSTLIQTGVLLNNNGSSTLKLNPDDENMKNMLQTIHGFFIDSNEDQGRNFGELYTILTSSENGIGLRYGIIPIYMAVVLHFLKGDLIIKNGENEEKLTPDLLNKINENPQNYSVVRDNWNEEKTEYVNGLEEIFREHVVAYEKSYNNFSYLVLAMNRWYISLPKYAKEMEKTYNGINAKKQHKSLSKIERSFINSLKQMNPNSFEYLFKRLLSVFEMDKLDLNILEKIRNVKNTFDYAVPKLIRALVEDIRSIFSKNGNKGSLTSIIMDWREGLLDTTVQFLFANEENRILDLMKNVTNDEHAFVQKLAKTTTGLRIEDWKPSTIDVFLEKLNDFKKSIEEHDRCGLEDSTHGAKKYTVIFSDDTGNDIVKTFNKAEYSNNAKLLLNDMTTSLDEMGEAITKQEKRQVLMELLEKLC